MTGQIRMVEKVITDNDSFSEADCIIWINSAMEDPISLTAPNPPDVQGRIYYIKVISIGTGSVTLDFGNTLNGSDANPVLTSADIGWSMIFASNGTYFYSFYKTP